MEAQPERQFRRFKLTYHVRVNFHSENMLGGVDGITRNIGLGGLLLESDCLIPHLSPVDFTIMISGGTVSRPVILAGVGDVVRVEPCKSKDRYCIAVTCRRPVTLLTDLPEAP
jgi:hypothetical protein